MKRRVRFLGVQLTTENASGAKTFGLFVAVFVVTYACLSVFWALPLMLLTQRDFGSCLVGGLGISIMIGSILHLRSNA